MLPQGRLAGGSSIGLPLNASAITRLSTGAFIGGSLVVAAALSEEVAWGAPIPAAGMVGAPIDPQPASRLAHAMATGTKVLVCLRRGVGGAGSAGLTSDLGVWVRQDLCAGPAKSRYAEGEHQPRWFRGRNRPAYGIVILITH